MHNLSGSVRSYELQSQIFPEQGAIIAIGAQVKATSAQGTAASSLLDFNNNLEDRIIPKKIDPPLSNSFAFNDNGNEKFEKLKTNLNTIREFFFEPKTIIDPQKSESPEQSSEYKSALRDTIIYFQETIKSNTAGRAIIPVKISLTMDGIGGLVIGHLFKIPLDLLPRGYGSDNVGGKLIQTITSISHKVENGDWTTTIDALNIVTKEPFGLKDKTFNDLLTETKTGFSVTTPLGFQNLTGPWTERAFQIITRFEGFEPVAKYDINHYRGGYGSDKKLVNGVLENVTLNTTFTKEEAKATLIYEIANSYGPRVIGQIGIGTWGRLNQNQQAALVSYAYNAGAGALNSWGITKNLQDGRDDLAAQSIKRGPTTANGFVLNGLVTRREQESILFTTA
jgi:GH24 family phage-related lysozyme (muramidase)